MQPSKVTPSSDGLQAHEVARAVEESCARIAPTWPLDWFIAVNPFWSFTEHTPAETSARLTALAGTRLLMPRAWYREQWREGRFRAQHLRAAVAEAGSRQTVDGLLAMLEREAPLTPRRALVTDVFDEQELARPQSWGDFVRSSLSQFCASYFDAGQALVQPVKEGGLYASYRRWAQEDRTPALVMGLRGHRELLAEIPAPPLEAITTALAHLDVPPSQHETYLTSLLMDVNGWAAWCAYLRWVQKLNGGDDAHLVELLAARITWEWLLHRAGGKRVAARWQMAVNAWPAADGASTQQADDWLFQRALEMAYQEELLLALPHGLSAPRPQQPAVQAVFCIDVRSEVLRRALEFASEDVQTLGFAGFFGVPMEYQPMAGGPARPQLPGLLAPRVRAVDTGLSAQAHARRISQLDRESLWARFKASAASGFSFVESMGPLYAGKLLAASLGREPPQVPEVAGLTPRERQQRKPRLSSRADGGELTLSARCDLALGILRGMSLTRGFARLLVLIGHGSETVNNPHAAGLDCGACCGQTGEVNARALAALLNDPLVRLGLRERGIELSDSTRVLAGLHNTTTDEVALFDLDELPSSHAADLAQLKAWLETAGERARAERAPGLGITQQTAQGIQRAVTERARDWSQVRPEWGLAGNAALIVAPREHCRHMDLEGRSFLHDYRWREDHQFAVLELIMTAPMVVTNWINMQYYASTVDNGRYGSGNKLLHNVVGGHLGVFEGNGGDLRIGLPLQSLHDGTQWVHTPLRLSVFIEAPRDAIAGVLAKHPKVRELVDNEWLFLFQIDEGERQVNAYRRGTWKVLDSSAP